VLLVDPSASTQLIAGDNVSFVVSHHDVGGKRLLSFVFTRNPDCRCEDKRQQPTAPPKGRDPGPVAGGADFKTGVVEEVLSAEDDGYRSTGYIVQAQGKRIAIADPIAQTHYGIGDSITFLAVRTKIKGSSLLAFMALPPDINGAKPDPAAIPGMTSEAKLITAPQSGGITEVLTANDADYSYRAYIVEMLGARLVVEDSSGAGAHQVGEQLAFVASTFSRLIRRALALRPAHSRCHQVVTRLTKGFHYFVTSIVAPVASGWSICRVGFSPTEKAPPFHGTRQLRPLAQMNWSPVSSRSRNQPCYANDCKMSARRISHVTLAPSCQSGRFMPPFRDPGTCGCFGTRQLRDEQAIDLLQHQLAVVVTWFCDSGNGIYWAHQGQLLSTEKNSELAGTLWSQRTARAARAAPGQPLSI
jgi:hypothetical protein